MGEPHVPPRRPGQPQRAVAVSASRNPARPGDMSLSELTIHRRYAAAAVLAGRRLPVAPHGFPPGPPALPITPCRRRVTIGFAMLELIICAPILIGWLALCGPWYLSRHLARRRRRRELIAWMRVSPG